MISKEDKGITLIALVITIIILLILAGITIATLTGNNGVLNKATIAQEKTDEETAKESINLKITNIQMSTYAESQRMPTLQEVADNFYEDDEIEYLLLKSESTASKEKIEIGKNKSFFTKLKDYPYEFEINSSLQLASVNGVKVATTPVSDVKFYSLDNDITINSNAETIEVFDFTNLETGTYLININLYSNANANANVFGYIKTEESNNSKPARYYFTGYNGYTVSTGCIIIEHIKGNEMKLLMNNYCSTSIKIDAANSNAGVIRIK